MYTALPTVDLSSRRSGGPSRDASCESSSGHLMVTARRLTVCKNGQAKVETLWLSGVRVLVVMTVPYHFRPIGQVSSELALHPNG